MFKILYKTVLSLGIQDWPSPNGERNGPQKWDGNSTSNIQQHQWYWRLTKWSSGPKLNARNGGFLPTSSLSSLFLIEISILMIFGNSLEFFPGHHVFSRLGPDCWTLDSLGWRWSPMQLDWGECHGVFCWDGNKGSSNIPIAEMDLLGLLKRYVLEQKHRFQIWQGSKHRF